MPREPESLQETQIIEIKPQPVAEMRGLRLLLPRGGASRAHIDQLTGRAQDAGINTLIVRVYRRGTTLWPSEAAPSWRLPRVRHWLGRRDVLAELARSCVRRNLALCAWVDLLPALDLSRERSSPLTKRHWAWRMRRFSGEPYPMVPENSQVFLCPARLEVRQFLGDICTELADRYGVEALWLEGLRYPVGANRPDTSFCFCPVCVNRVKAELGIDLESTPLDDESESYQAWTSWREDQLRRLLECLLARVRKVRSGLLMMSGVPAGWNEVATKRTGLCDWVRWVREGLLELASPMWFGAPGAITLDERLQMLQGDIEATTPFGRVAPLLPLQCLRERDTRLLETIRQLPMSGHIWDGVGESFTQEDWDLMRQHHGDHPALVPEIDPLDAMRVVTGESLHLVGDETPLGIELDDLLGILQSGYGQFSDKQLEKLLMDLEAFERQAKRRELECSEPDRLIRNLNWLQRQLVFLRGRQLLTRGH